MNPAEAIVRSTSVGPGRGAGQRQSRVQMEVVLLRGAGGIDPITLQIDTEVQDATRMSIAELNEHVAIAIAQRLIAALPGSAPPDP